MGLALNYSNFDTLLNQNSFTMKDQSLWFLENIDVTGIFSISMFFMKVMGSRVLEMESRLESLVLITFNRKRLLVRDLDKLEAEVA